jgi:predicted restriction endonuclease
MDIEVVEDDRRQKVPASVVIRRGQRRFREALLTAFDRCCAVSGCAVVELLEAAHISPYKGEHTDRPDNGLLLRADLHTLFDLDLLTIRATDLTIAVAPVIDDPLYRALQGRRLRSRRDGVETNREFLLKHNHKCRWLLQDATTGGN